MINGEFTLKPAEVALRKVRRTVDIPFVFRNPTADTFRLPAPIAPRQGVLQWHAGNEKIGPAETVPVVWPVALGPGGWLQIDVTARPEIDPGRYRVTLHSAEEPETLWASREVILTAPTGQTPQ